MLVVHLVRPANAASLTALDGKPIFLELRADHRVMPCSTLVECDFSTTNFRQCNLSRVSGFNVPMGFQYDAPDCGGNFWYCTKPGAIEELF